MITDGWQPVVEIMNDGIDTGVFPGAVLMVGNRQGILFARAFGLANRYTRQAVTLDTVFDLASLTKPLATTPAVMKLIQQGGVFLETKIGDILPAFRETPKRAVEIRHLLYHTSGYPPHRPYYLSLKDMPLAERKRALRRMLVAEPLVRPVGAVMEYSDLGFMVLCWLIEEMTLMRFDHVVNREIFHPLGLRQLFFVDLAKPAPNVSFAATEQCPWRNTLLSGAVSDDNAWAVGGIEGHAGLFGTAGNVYSLLRALLAAHAGESDFCGISHSLIRTFLRRDSHSGRALGFDTPSSENSSSGTRFSKNTVGHLGFTGSSCWMDLQREVIVILLTNRVHPNRDNNLIRAFRPRLHDAVMDLFITDVFDTLK
ncbi:MAG: serine hydrolase domain-containing protein [Desulfobacterales bacterium]|nr:serine hydrolase domain-containing protein [Desulfobacterales bacterium]